MSKKERVSHIKKKVDLLPEPEALQRLIDRLPVQYPKRAFLEKELHRLKAGIRGEDRVVKKFKEFYIPEEYSVIWNVRLELAEWRVQLDGLLLTNRCAIVIESKNISGELNFHSETNEFSRIDEEGIRTVFEHPAIQLNKNCYFLEEWFKVHGFSLPVKGLVVFTAKQSEFASKPTLAHMCKLYQLNSRIINILKSYPSKSHFDFHSVKKAILANQLFYEQKPLCEQYHISESELKIGIRCRSCGLYSVSKLARSWICTGCREKQTAIETDALCEYFSLISTKVTNKEFRRFFKIDSQDVVTRIFAKHNLLTAGERKTRVYMRKKE